MEKIVLEFDKEKETKGTWRYEEKSVNDQPVIGKIYIKKALVDDFPDRIRLTIEPAS